jgi:hypothetical protein
VPSCNPFGGSYATSRLLLSQLDADFKTGKYGYVDGMLIVRHGKLVYDRLLRGGLPCCAVQ